MTRVDASTVWQVTAGPADRPYADVLLRYGVMLIGPGESGEWRPGRIDLQAARQVAGDVLAAITFGSLTLVFCIKTRLIAYVWCVIWVVFCHEYGCFQSV